jgi:hypothetical protein
MPRRLDFGAHDWYTQVNRANDKLLILLILLGRCGNPLHIPHAISVLALGHCKRRVPAATVKRIARPRNMKGRERPFSFSGEAVAAGGARQSECAGDQPGRVQKRARSAR